LGADIQPISIWAGSCERGSLFFPLSWLGPDVVEFYGMRIHVVAPELQYVLKEHPEYLNPDWRLREKDILEKKYFKDLLIQNGTDICSLYKFVTSSSRLLEENAE
jgi:hypothetical protein